MSYTHIILGNGVLHEMMAQINTFSALCASPVIHHLYGGLTATPYRQCAALVNFNTVTKLLISFAFCMVWSMEMYSASAVNIATILRLADLHPMGWLLYVISAPFVDLRSCPSPAKYKSLNISKPPLLPFCFVSYFRPSFCV